MIYAFLIDKLLIEMICFFFTDLKVWLFAKNFCKLVEDSREFDRIQALATLPIDLVVILYTVEDIRKRNSLLLI